MARPFRVRPFWLFLATGVILAPGCANFPEKAATPSFFQRLCATGLADQPFVQIDVAILERPIGDPYLTQELWQGTDEMLVDLDRKAAVEDNGYRVGQIVGLTPAALHQLLKSERSCLNPRRRLVTPGHAVTVYLGPVLPQTRFSIQRGRHREAVALDQARFCLDVTANLAADGKTRLAFLPKVENGEQALPFQPNPELSTWTLRVERPSRAYPEAAWEVTLAPNDFLVVGAMPERLGSLGHHALVQDDDHAQVQRLLVLRTSRSAAALDTGGPTLEDIARSSKSPCLAVQAAYTAARASGR